MRTHKQELLGELTEHALDDFPVCVKLLDTNEPLSIQDHPHDEREAPAERIQRNLRLSEEEKKELEAREAAERQRLVKLGNHEVIIQIADECEVGVLDVIRVAERMKLNVGAKDFEGLTPAGFDLLRIGVEMEIGSLIGQRRVRDGRLIRRGKSECWLVLDAARDAVIYQGLREGVRAQDFELALDGGGPAELMNARAVKPGDFLYNPAGMVHAIGGGLALLEIPQNCPTTYRLWDFPRAEKREMHINEGLGAARFNLPLPPIQPTHRDEEVLAPLGPFGVRSLRIAKASRDLKYGPGFTVHTCLQGECEITSHARDKLEPTILKRGETVLWPAVFDKFEYFPRGDCWIIQSWARE
jgi:mannose-6-phosphate isomerase class I